jgi:hypothetical protein
MNTTSLIRHWSMSGAHRDLTGRFRSTDDIRAILFGVASSRPKPGPRELLMKRADEEDWRPLPAGVGRG